MNRPRSVLIVGDPEKKHKEWIQHLKSDTIERSPEHEAVSQKFLKDLKERGGMFTIAGFFGPETVGCDAYQEEVIHPPGGGTLVKAYGCSYPLKFIPWPGRTEGLELAKSLISKVPRDIVGGSILYASAVMVKFIFFRTRFFHDLDQLLWEIEWKVVRHWEPKPQEYNNVAREVNRAAGVAIHAVFGIDITKTVDPTKIKRQSSQLGYLLNRVKRFFVLLLESDPCYRFRFQDAFGNLNLLSAGKDGVEEFFRLMRIMASRETQYGIGNKWTFIEKALKIGLFLEPRLKKTLNYFIATLDIKKIVMDESDWYFCLKYRSYNFGGLLEEERFAEWDRINKERGHVFLL